MRFLMPTFLVCGLLIQVTTGGLSQPRCWKNNIGYCRSRCLDDERYIILCKNKLSCCIPIVFPSEFTRKPQPPLIRIEDITSDLGDWDTSPNSPVTKINDQFTFHDNLSLVFEKSTVDTSGTIQPMTTPMQLPFAAAD
ncbi:beta-defensin 125 [Marmota flaviventris]|uniref:beta-defensin 125 n=1 Tax=Marmota flaviventris TaxID=93162 RepID=UPI000FFF6C53|nr:beta-defensin 125 [Marmota flaviventris]